MITPAYGLTATERVLPSFVLDWTTGLAQDAVDVARTGVATYIDSSGVLQLAAENTQRVDYSTGTSGLLVEESRTNLARASEDLSNTSYWVALTDASVAPNAAIAPDGTTTASEITFAVTGSTARIFQSSFGNVIGGNYTASMWLWADEGEATAVFFQITNSAGASFVSEVISLTSTPTRFSITGAATDTTIRIQLRAANAGKKLYAWGAQLEAGAFPTSYIPTEASAVTRNADVATVTGTNFSDFFNPTEGGLMVDATAAAFSNAPGLISFSDGTYTGNLIQINIPSAGTPRLRVAVAGSNVVNNINAGTTITANNRFRTAGAYKADDFGFAVNGGTAATQSSGALPSPDQLRIGLYGAPDPTTFNGHIHKILYWPQRITTAEVRAFSK